MVMSSKCVNKSRHQLTKVAMNLRRCCRPVTARQLFFCHGWSQGDSGSTVWLLSDVDNVSISLCLFSHLLFHFCDPTAVQTDSSCIMWQPHVPGYLFDEKKKSLADNYVA